MKKALCGLVIALMMTGSGYADISRDECKYLKTEAENYVSTGKLLNMSVNKEADRLAKMDFSDPSYNEERDNKEREIYANLTSMTKREIEAIKKGQRPFDTLVSYINDPNYKAK